MSMLEFDTKPFRKIIHKLREVWHHLDVRAQDLDDPQLRDRCNELRERITQVEGFEMLLHEELARARVAETATTVVQDSDLDAVEECNELRDRINKLEGAEVLVHEALARQLEANRAPPATVMQHVPQSVKLPEPLAARGPFAVVEIGSDGVYGDGGPNGCTGFMAFGIADAQGRVLFDSLNRDAGATEIHDEIDDESGRNAWDEGAKRDADAIVAMLNGATP